MPIASTGIRHAHTMGRRVGVRALQSAEGLLAGAVESVAAVIGIEVRTLDSTTHASGASEFDGNEIVFDVRRADPDGIVRLERVVVPR